MSRPVNSGKVYDETFFSYASSVSKRAAEPIVPIALKKLPPIKSVLDIGCAQGTWLNCWAAHGVTDIQGVDGDYVDRYKLAIPVGSFQAQDLNEPVDLGRTFDLACSFEVAEHVRAENAERFVESLTRHASLVLFSAAPPGQGGENHVNEQPYDYWRRFFRKKGYSAFDCIRSEIVHFKQIPYWYRYNMLLFVHRDWETRLSPQVAATKIPDDAMVRDISPPLFKARKLIVKMLPGRLVNPVAKLKSAVLSKRAG